MEPTWPAGEQVQEGWRFAFSLSDWSGSLILTELTPQHRAVTPVAPTQAGELLSARFGLTG